MTEKELREKMAGLYSPVPADTHAAFEHALTHHRETEKRVHRVSKVRFALVFALLMALLATGAYAVYYRYSVSEFMSNDSQAFRDHTITLDETYENDLFTMTVNDLVFDGSNFAVAMNIIRHDPDSAYYMRTKVTALSAGEEYMVDVEGSRGLDFLAGSMWPEYGYYPDPAAAEREGFGFDGVLWNWDDNPPPAGEPVDWTMTFTVFRPLWPIIVDKEFSLSSAAMEDELERRIIEAWNHQQIYMYSGDVNSYLLIVSNEMGLDWDMPWEEMMVATGAFELADVITFHFVTEFDDDVIREELIGQRYELGDYAAVIDGMNVSFQRITCSMYLDFGRPMSYEELEAADLPDSIEVYCETEAGPERLLGSTSCGIAGVRDSEEWRFDVGFSFFADMNGISALTVQGFDEDYEHHVKTPREDFRFTIELP